MAIKIDPSWDSEPGRHWRAFVDFCRYETWAGGPDPHMAVIGHMIKNEPLAERVWRMGCYLSVFNVPTAEVIWRRWSQTDALNDRAGLENWLREHWAGIKLRRERRPVKAPHKLAECLSAYAAWMGIGWPAAQRAKTYDELFEAVGRVRYAGRYATIKLCEGLRRYCDVGPAQDDLRPRGGKHPRLGLSYLYPQHRPILLGGDAKPNLRFANELAIEVRARLIDAGLSLSHWSVEAMLCDYKQAFHSRQYPGRSQDSELAYWDAVNDYWNAGTEMFDARSAIFPREVLGELTGWTGVREELTTVLRDYGYTWSDALYDYNATLASGDFEHPVSRT